MYSDHFAMEGRNGVKLLDQWGPYAVIANRRLYEQGNAAKYAVVNTQDRWVDSVYYSNAQAANQARQLYQL